MLTFTQDIELESDHACAVYDAKTGRIEHVHRVITLKGGKTPERTEIEARAIEMATRNGRAASQLKTLLVSADKLHEGARYKVDLKTGSLISEPVKRRPK
jgi:hypothetical protein